MMIKALPHTIYDLTFIILISTVNSLREIGKISFFFFLHFQGHPLTLGQGRFPINQYTVTNTQLLPLTQVP